MAAWSIASRAPVIAAVPLALLAACSQQAAFAGAALLATSAQHVLVVVEQERDSTGTLYRFERDGERWRQVAGPVRATVGAGGVNKSREGDRKSPSGAYALRAAFGYGAEPPDGVRLEYIALQPETECVDDPSSPYYNRIVNPSELDGGRTWASSEMMRRDLHAGDDLYRLGVVVDYNSTGNGRGETGNARGSCIFLHLWRGPDRPTVGCTAFVEGEMVALLRWLNPAHLPILVQGSRAELEKLRSGGLLPYGVP
jgi:D-alanyl-D-alanine dipeptidase